MYTTGMKWRRGGSIPLLGQLVIVGNSDALWYATCKEAELQREMLVFYDADTYTYLRTPQNGKHSTNQCRIKI